MANRHSHKKQRAEIRARMAQTGESYQKARQALLVRRDVPERHVDLVPFSFFGVPMTLATMVTGPIHAVAVLRATPRGSRSFGLPVATWLRPRGWN